MHKKSKLPKISDQEAAELTQAVQFAYGDDEADEFFDKAMEWATHLRALRLARERSSDPTNL